MHLSGEPSPQEVELDNWIQNYRRTHETEPYQAGYESLAAQLKPLLGDSLFCVAYNEFCPPALEETIENMIKEGAFEISFFPSMFTSGGSSSSFIIPEIPDHIQA